MNTIYENQSAESAIIRELRRETNKGDEVDRIEYGDGIRMYLKGHPYYFKGKPTPDAIYAVNIIKKLIRIPMTPRMFDTVAWPIMSPHILLSSYQTAFTREVIAFITNFLIALRIDPRHMPTTIAHVFEYDFAYRIRVQDIITETTAPKLLKSPINEIKRLLDIGASRESMPRQRAKLSLLYHMRWVLLIPRIRKAFKSAVRKMDITKLQLDENDRYWLNIKQDYGK